MTDEHVSRVTSTRVVPTYRVRVTRPSDGRKWVFVHEAPMGVDISLYIPVRHHDAFFGASPGDQIHATVYRRRASTDDLVPSPEVPFAEQDPTSDRWGKAEFTARFHVVEVRDTLA